MKNVIGVIGVVGLAILSSVAQAAPVDVAAKTAGLTNAGGSFPLNSAIEQSDDRFTQAASELITLNNADNAAVSPVSDLSWSAQLSVKWEGMKETTWEILTADTSALATKEIESTASASIPDSSSLAILGVGVIGLGFIRKRRDA